MPMELIEVVQCEYINILLDEIYSKEMATHIKVHSAISEAGSIVYNYGWKN